jgi:hypothetical protein
MVNILCEMIDETDLEIPSSLGPASPFLNRQVAAAQFTANLLYYVVPLTNRIASIITPHLELHLLQTRSRFLKTWNEICYGNHTK